MPPSRKLSQNELDAVKAQELARKRKTPLDIQAQVDAGTLKVRKLTPEEMAAHRPKNRTEREGREQARSYVRDGRGRPTY